MKWLKIAGSFFALAMDASCQDYQFYDQFGKNDEDSDED
jgi:hypothetical protein